MLLVTFLEHFLDLTWRKQDNWAMVPLLWSAPPGPSLFSHCSQWAIQTTECCRSGIGTVHHWRVPGCPQAGERPADAHWRNQQILRGGRFYGDV